MTDELIPAKDFCTIGEAAFGHHWQTALANALEVNDRTVRRWVSEGAPIKLKPELRDFLLKRHDAIAKALKLVKD